jgi:3-phenylpropionate/trans-cinnamate dioxygenase ferredoxin subunit
MLRAAAQCLPEGVERKQDMSEFVPAVPLDSLKEGEVTAAKIGSQQIALYIVDGTPYCTEDICTHEECNISDGGFVEGDEVECPCHGARFNVKTGEVTAPPAIEPMRPFPVEVRDGQVYVRVG